MYWDPFGNVQWGDKNRYSFAGQEYDETTELKYMRARYYDSYFQRFITRDPVKGEYTIPQSQHPYMYVYNNPVNLKDPSGEQIPPQIIGKAGEVAALIVKNTQRIPSVISPGKYRIPDQLLRELKLLSEVKNVKYQSLSKQLRDFLLYSQQYGFKFELIVRKDTILSAPLSELVKRGIIKLRIMTP